MTQDKVYEIRDVTDDDMFYQVALFFDKTEAEKCINEIDPESCQAYHDDDADFELVEFEVGLHHGRYNVLTRVSYKKIYDEDDEYQWELQ
jgi:hypothetical protein